jgi:potassium efflux system protein
MDWETILNRSEALLDLPLFQIAGTPITLATILVFFLIVLMTLWISRIVQAALVRALLRTKVIDDATVGVFRRLVHYLLLVVGVGIALDTVGIHLGTLFAAGAVLAVAVGFAMQNITQNFLSGVILLGERAIKPGDIIEVDDVIVRVKEVGIRTTLVRTREEEEVIIPNSTLVQSSVKNFTLNDSLYRVRVQVGVVYSSDMGLVMETLKKAAEGVEGRNTDMEPVILMVGFGDSSVNFDVSIWINHPWDSPANRSELHQAIWWGLKDAGITIAFPQLDVHFDPPVVESLGGMRMAAGA